MPSGWLTCIYITPPVFSSHLCSIFFKEISNVGKKVNKSSLGRKFASLLKENIQQIYINLTLFLFKVHLQVLTENHRALHLMVN